MPCGNPLTAFRTAKGIAFGTPTKGERLQLPCGQCLGCRLDRAATWATRITHEASLHEDNCWITLTYRDREAATPEQREKLHFINPEGSLVKKDLQKFFKRLRHETDGKRVRYYACGEYGDQLSRPHYHACLFGVSLDRAQLYDEGEDYRLFTSKTLDKTWPYGFSTVGDLTYKSAAYTARYTLKKITGDAAHDHYLKISEDGEQIYLEPEFATMSRRPGIGADWLDRHHSDIYPRNETPILGPRPRVVRAVPKYYDKRMEDKHHDDAALEKAKASRLQYKEQNPGRYTRRATTARAKILKARTQSLIRNLNED